MVEDAGALVIVGVGVGVGCESVVVTVQGSAAGPVLSVRASHPSKTVDPCLRRSEPQV